MDIAPFISDMRIIQNIYNEFVVYKKTLQTEQHLNLSDEQMMAIIIFKNLYPSDFADIQGEKGIIKKAFQDRNVYVFTKIKELQQKIDSNTELVEKTTQNIFKSVRELKYAFLVEITEGEGVARGFNGYPGRISSANVLSDNFDLHQFQEKDYRAEYVSFSGHTGVVDMSEKVDVVDEYIKRCEAIKKYTDKNIEKIKEEIIELKNKKQKLVKYQPFSRHKKLIHIFRKMNGAKRIINIRKLIFFLNLFRQIFTFQRLLFQKLMKQLHNCFIGKSCRKPVNRLKAVEDLLIGCRGENFRMFHLKLTLPPDHPASEYKNTSLFQSIFQIGSIKPGNRKPAAAVTYCHGDYLLSSYRIYINAGTYCSGDSFYRPLFKICNICRRFILVIIPGIIPEKGFCVRNTYFLEQLLRFFSYSFQSS